MSCIPSRASCYIICLHTPIPILQYFQSKSVTRQSLPSFPTRRSSDLPLRRWPGQSDQEPADPGRGQGAVPREVALVRDRLADRKSTRLNSSHLVISYAVLFL